jgi:hypothetical protein
VSFDFLEFLGLEIIQALCAVRPVCGCPFLSNDSIFVSEALRQQVLDLAKGNFELAATSKREIALICQGVLESCIDTVVAIELSATQQDRCETRLPYVSQF